MKGGNSEMRLLRKRERCLQVIRTEVDMAYLFEVAKLIWDCIGEGVVVESEVK
ncbi:hypothetical protein QJS04_geneDACA000039 [Acorus gramineus]|uniref:Uncharacterized protein n=1 Tax=Acorus gramineus TaxID=55184 RepID=A0AAV9ASF4_ACOGR|nr:hypothetical protein QJS04_geneDACA000039 [Acorus gramineus]